LIHAKKNSGLVVARCRFARLGGPNSDGDGVVSCIAALPS